MGDQWGGVPWILVHAGIVVLGIVLVYGILRGRRLSARQKNLQQKKTRENFRVDEDSA
jgi:uncharacterized integral membrane protein